MTTATETRRRVTSILVAVPGEPDSHESALELWYDLQGTPVIDPIHSTYRYRPDRLWLYYDDKGLRRVQLEGPQITVKGVAAPKNRVSEEIWARLDKPRLELGWLWELIDSFGFGSFGFGGWSKQ